MSLQTRLIALAQAVGADIKSLNQTLSDNVLTPSEVEGGGPSSAYAVTLDGGSPTDGNFGYSDYSHVHANPTYLGSLAGITPTALPADYLPNGVSVGHVTTTDGWPVTGTLTTSVSASTSRVVQRLTAYNGGAAEYRRTYHIAGWTAWGLSGDDSGWIEMTGFLNGATPYQAGLGNAWTPRYRKLNGIVYMAGLFNSNTTAGLHFFTLPSGFRPGTGESMFAAGHTGTGVRRLDISISGLMVLREQFSGVPTTAWHQLQACSFIAES